MQFHHSKTLCPLSWFSWNLLFSLLLVTVLIFLWKGALPPSTNLHERILTVDGKSFPSGQLTWSRSFTPLPCGRSAEEAKARNCRFDMISTAWLPPKCIDDELVAEFAAVHPWQFFRDANGTEQLPNDAETLGSEPGTIWTTYRWHSAHCLYMWKKLNRALVNGWMTDAETIKQGHTDHCVKIILGMTKPDAIVSMVEVIFPPC
ncbi:hypothetical protein LY78DRAFT_708816 [Colletotrichum sublineola]|nr:hypothetical protein LY78DRAFT_708816 [Colletotrichum sublineola]